MTPEKLREFIDRSPFIPIRIHLASGAVVDVLQSGLAHPLRHSLMVLQPYKPGRSYHEYQEINYRLIERIEQLPEPAQSA
jgi:hypothetical protein